MSEKKVRVSPMKGRKISEEDRGENAPKLGRPFVYNESSKKYVVTIMATEVEMSEFLRTMKTDRKGTAFKMAMDLVSKS